MYSTKRARTTGTAVVFAAVAVLGLGIVVAGVAEDLAPVVAEAAVGELISLGGREGTNASESQPGSAAMAAIPNTKHEPHKVFWRQGPVWRLP